MTSTNSDEIKSVSHTTDSELQIRNEQIQNFIYPNMPKSNPHLYDKNKTRIISTNLFQLEYNDIFHNLTLFKIEEKPSLEENNYFLRRKIYNYIETHFPKNFKKNFFSGNILFSVIYVENQEQKNLYNKISFNETIGEKEYEITLTKIKEIKFKEVNDFSGNNQKIKQYIEILLRNIVLKNPNVVYFKNRSLFEINMNNIVKVTSDNKENIFRGYMTSAHITENGLFILINNINKVISGKTVLQKIKEIENEFNGLPKKEIQQKIKDYFQTHRTVLTTYGIPRTYKIKEIDFDKTPDKIDINIKDRNNINKEEKTITLFNYYTNVYHINIDLNQPIITAEQKVNKKNNELKKKENEDVEYIIYLIPELLYLTGIEEEGKFNLRKRQKNLDNKTKINPSKKMKLINGFFDLYNSNNHKEIEKGNKKLTLKSPKELAEEWGIKLGNNLTFQGRIIPPPKLNFKNLEKSKENQIVINQVKVINGLFSSSFPIRIKDITEENLIFLYDANDTNMTKYNLFNELCKKFQQKGFKISQIHKIFKIGLRQIYNWENIEDNLRKLPIYDNTKKFGILFCSKKLESHYDKLKDFFLKKLNIPTQHINTKNLENKSSKISSILSNIVDQINIKLGGMNYYIDFKDQNVIYEKEIFLIIGLDSKNFKGKITYSMTSSTNGKLNLSMTQEKTVLKKYKEERKNALKMMFFKAIVEIKKSPDYIILYRKGGNDYYNRSLAVDELYIFKDALNELKNNNKNNECNYKNSKFYYICCNLKTDLKFFEEGQNKTYINPQSGLVVDKCVTQKNKFEFYLQPQYVNEGTATPSHYQIMYYDQENNNLEMERLQKLTFLLTFYYWNWHGAIRIPALLKFSTSALDFCSRCFKIDEQDGEYTFQHPYFI